MRNQFFYEYDASTEAPEVAPGASITGEEAPTAAVNEVVEEQAPIAPDILAIVGGTSEILPAIEAVVEETPVAPELETTVYETPVAPETGMKKHKYNILPAMSAEESEALKASIQKNGYDRLNFPIMVIASDSGDVIVDGWNRWKVCQELNIEPTFKRFEGNDEQVLEFIMKTNTRRNLTPEQWAVLAVQNEEILQTIRKQVEAEAKENQVKNLAKGDKITVTPLVGNEKKDKHKNEAKTKVAKKVNTTPKLLAAVENLKEEHPEEFSNMADDILKGDTTIRKIKAGKKKAAALLTKTESINVVASPSENQDNEDTIDVLTDTEILQMVKRVRIKVKGMAKLIIYSGMDNESIEMNQQHLKVIEKLQLDLGIRLTGFKK